MKKIIILVPHGAILGSIEGPHKLFTEINSFLRSQGRDPIFKLQLAGSAKHIKLNEGMYTVTTDITLKDAKKPDLIIIPAIHGDLKTAIAINKEFIPWIRKQYSKGAEVASLCVGAFILASTGLLKGKSCATHWLFANEFRKMFPDVNLVDDKIITDENGIYSSGGAYSYLNLILYLVEKYAGRELALLSSKIFQIDIDRWTQSPFLMFVGQKDHEDEHVKKAQEFIEKNYREKISVDQIAMAANLGRRNLERRFKKATSNTIVEYVQRVKVEASKKDLETGRKNINEVMYDIGYSDDKSFRTVFKKFTGLSPVHYKNKYSQRSA